MLFAEAKKKISIGAFGHLDRKKSPLINNNHIQKWLISCYKFRKKASCKGSIIRRRDERFATLKLKSIKTIDLSFLVFHYRIFT